MARNLFGGTAADVAEDASGVRVPGVTGSVWDGPSDGAVEVTDLQDLTGAPMQLLTSDDNGMLPAFFGPEDGALERLYVDFGGGRVAILASDVGDRLREHLVAPDPHGDRSYADATFIRATEAGWVSSPNARITRAKGIHVPATWGEFWRPKRDAAMATSKAAVAVVGGSDAAGFYASQLVTASWPGVLSSTLRTAYGDGGSGFRSAMVSAQGIGGQDSAAISQWTATGGLLAQSGAWSIGGHLAGPGWGYLYASTPGASLTFTVAGTSVGIYTLGADGGRAQWSYAIDSAPAVDVSESATTGLSGLKSAVSGLAPGPHTVTIRHTGVTGQFLSVCGVSGENDTGIVLNNFGRKNATAAGYAHPARISWSGGSDYPADLVIYSVSAEDVLNATSPDAWASSVHQHLAHIRDSGSAVGATDIVLVLPHIGRADTAGFRYADFVDRSMSLAFAFDAALINFWGRGRNAWSYWNSLGHWANPASPGTSGTDAVHLSDAGHSYVAATLNALLQS